MIIHLDMDAFYASVEIREHPELAGRPVVVGGSPEGRGVVSAANYLARQFGVHSAMPMRQALQRCPQAARLPVRMDLYSQVSAQIHAIFSRYTPCIEPLSLDEAFLDTRASERLFGSVEEIARRIKDEIWSELGLVASVGVAPNKFLAKLASDIDKPNGFRVIYPDEVQAFLDPLPVCRLWGVGKASEAILLRLGIRTIAEVRQQSPAVLQAHLGKLGAQLAQLSRGIDEREVVPERPHKSISHEHTFGIDVSHKETLRACLLELTEHVAWRMRQQGVQGRTVQLKLRYHDFRTYSRSKTLNMATASTATLWQTAQDLLEACLREASAPVRLLGVGVSGFGANDIELAQGSLFEAARQDDKRLDEITDTINGRFGRATIKRATTIKTTDE